MFMKTVVMKTTVMKKILPTLACALALVACATHDANNDPLEGFNRGVFAFNRGVDTYLIRPIAKTYRYVTPQGFRDHVGNVSDNLHEPLSMVSAFLEGDVQQGMVNFWRFAINTTIGLGGINDVATTAGLKARTEDVGQAFAVWGIGSGPYLVLPLLGPSNGRDAVGRVAGWFANPVTYAVDDGWTSAGIAAGQALVERERLLDPIDDVYASSLDPYASFRSIYQQRRKAQIENLHGGEDKHKL